MHRQDALASRLTGWAACFTLLAGGAIVQAAPEIQNLSPRGLRIGATTTVAIDGADLSPDSRLLLPLAVAKQAVKPESTPNRLLIDVTLPRDLSPGHYLLRLGNARGISNAVLIGVDDLPQMAMVSEVAKLPVALTGNLPTGGSVTTSFAGKKGQRIVVDLEARRLGANFDPVLELQDARRVPIASAQGKAGLGGDARVDTVLPADDVYTVLVRDALYQGGAPDHFRLKIGELHYADLALPLGIQRGTKATIQLIGNLPGDGRVTVGATTALGDVPAALPSLPGMTGFAPMLALGEYPEILEVEQQPGKLQEVAAPAAINGRLSKHGEEDRFRLLVKPGMQLRFDVLANRSGSPLDGVLAIRNETGAQYTASDDRGDTVDPGFEFTVPEKINSLIVAIKDLHDRGGPDFVYRIAVTPVGVPDFSLSAQEERVNLPLGGTVALRVRAQRMGYNGPIKLSLPALPASVMLSGQEIPGGGITETLLTISAPPGLSMVPVVGPLVGESVDPNAHVRRLVMTPESASLRGQPWLRSEFGFAVAPSSPIAVAWDTNGPALPLDYTYAAKVKVTRAMGNQGPIRLSLLTSQLVPKTADGKADDVNRALRVMGTPMIAAGQDAGQAPVLVPKDLPNKPYDLVIRAELLSPDGKQVLATAVTPSRRLTPISPLVVALTTPATAEVIGTSAGIKMKGIVGRQGGFDKPVTVSLVGLPAGVPVPAVIVPENKSEFELPLVLPTSTKLSDLLNVKLVATSVLNPQVTLRSNEIPIKLQVIAGDTAAKKP